MEAPEKIYILRHEDYSDRRIFNAFTEKESNTDVEYVRKDAFIEKVRKFMEKIDNVDEYTWYDEEEHAVGITEKCIEDFKKYIKG